MEDKGVLSTALTAEGFNSTSNTTKDETAMENIDIFQVITLSVIILSSFIGNVLVISVVVLRSEIRTRTNYFFANLALIGIGCSLSSMVLMMIGLIPDNPWLWKHDLCKVNCFLWQLWLTEGVFTILALSVHKYASVIMPLMRVINRKRTLIVLALTWILAFLVAAAPLIGWRDVSFNSESSVCFYNTAASEALQISHVVFVTSIDYVLPIIAVFVIYVRVFREISKHKSRIRDTKIIDDMGVRAKQRLVITICIILTLFFLCWTPLFIYGVLTFFVLHLPSEFLSAIFYCGFLFNVLFPITLAIRNPRFRRGFCDVLTCRSFRKDNQTDLGLSFSSMLSNTNSGLEFLEERRCSIWYMSTQKNLLSIEPVPPERRLKLRWIETNL